MAAALPANQLNPQWPPDLNPDVPAIAVIPPSNNLKNAILGLRYAITRNNTSIRDYRDAVTVGLTNIRDVLNQLIPLINNITQQLKDAIVAGDPERIQQLEAQKAYLLQVVNAADQNVRTLLSNPGDVDADGTRANAELAGVQGLNPALATTNFGNVVTSLQSALTRAQSAANQGVPIGAPATEMPPGVINAGIKNRPTKQLSSAALRQKREKASKQVNPNPFGSDEADYYASLPGANARGGKGKRKTKKHQKKKQKKSNKTANKTTRRGKKMRGGYSYGKSKRRRGRSLPSSSAPSSLSNSSKNVILF
jgi:flagellar biosynthesis/type III secretory pathway chaperone